LSGGRLVQPHVTVVPPTFSWSSWTMLDAARDMSWQRECRGSLNAFTLHSAVREALFSRWGFAVFREALERPVRPVHAFQLVRWLGASLGRSRSQSPSGEHVGFLVDSGQRDFRVEQPLHTDGGDVLSLVCVRPACEGGQTRLVSAATAYSVIAFERPDLLRLLLAPWAYWRKGRPGPKTFSAPIFRLVDGSVHCLYLPGTLRATSAATGGAPLTSHELEALEYLDRVLLRPENLLEVYLQPGDAMLVNNRVVLHSRAAYMDDPDARRLFLRGWISV
jgi:alpha-ketoglutarate-dependent taurine dioxygenase